MADIYGRCDREAKCGYHLNPYTDGYTKDSTRRKFKPFKPITAIQAYMPLETLKQTLQGYEQNTFIQNLLHRVPYPFEPEDIEQVISLYRLGTIQNGYRQSAVTFPFIDQRNNIRAVQVKQFDSDNHTTATDYLHSIIEKQHTADKEPLPGWLSAYKKNEKKVSCLFGEHNLNTYPHNPVALVEAPKTAVYGALYFGLPEKPTDLLWLAVGNLSSLNIDRCKALRGRQVILFPDLDAFDNWKAKAETIQQQLSDINIKVSDLLQQSAPESDTSTDLADYLIKLDGRDFRQPATKQPTKEPEAHKPTEVKPKAQAEPVTKLFPFDIPTPDTPENWNEAIKELEQFFNGADMPAVPVKLNRFSTITNAEKYIKSHLVTLKANNGNRTFLPHLIRLQEFKQYIESRGLR